jgi:hypothetical protein
MHPKKVRGRTKTNHGASDSGEDPKEQSIEPSKPNSHTQEVRTPVGIFNEVLEALERHGGTVSGVPKQKAEAWSCPPVVRVRAVGGSKTNVTTSKEISCQNKMSLMSRFFQKKC